MMHRRTLLGGGALAALSFGGLGAPAVRAAGMTLAQNRAVTPDKPVDKSGGHGAGMTQPPATEDTPEERMRKRYPQPVKVGFLIGLPVLDWQDSTIGFVTNVVRTGEGKVQLIVPHGGWFGRGGRPVALPIETVAILARQIAALDWGRDEFAAAPTWTGTGTTPIDPNETIRIAITRR